MGLPVDVRDLYRFGKDITKDRDEPVSIAVLVEIDAPEALLDAVREALRPKTAQAFVDVRVIEEDAPAAAPGADAVVVLAGGVSPRAADAVSAVRAARVPVVALALAPDLGTLDYDLGLPTEDVLTREVPETLIESDLAAWLAERVGSKRLALAANFEFARQEVAMAVVKSTALQNTLIGTVTILPGTDMPLMTANQAKMLLQLASAYGQRIGTDRLGELAAIVGGGFLLRSVARQALTAVPGFGWVVKGGVAYTGTMAMGRAAIAWFEQGADVSEVAQRIKEMGGVRERPMPVEAVPANESREDGPVQQTLAIGASDDES